MNSPTNWQFATRRRKIALKSTEIGSSSFRLLLVVAISESKLKLRQFIFFPALCQTRKKLFASLVYLASRPVEGYHRRSPMRAWLSDVLIRKVMGWGGERNF